MIIGILIILALVTLGLIAWVVIPKLPLLSTLQIEESPQARWKRLKQHIVIGRMMRRIQKKSLELKKSIFTKERRERLGSYLHQMGVKLRKLEERYREQTKEHRVAMLIKKGEEEIAENSEDAEERFLQVVRLDPRNLEAYEGLLQIYLARKSPTEAAEVVDFLKKLNPSSISRYSFDLARLLFDRGELDKSRRYAEQALNDEPDSPKYLDFLVELAILGGKRGEAAQYVERLRAVNPENAKIGEFEERIKNLE